MTTTTNPDPTADPTAGLTILGTAGTPADARLETFPAPAGCAHVSLRSDEVTAMCPVTGQPDWYTVTIDHGVGPGARCVESKSLKLYLQSFREDGMFCEAFAARIAQDLADATRAHTNVTVEQKSRGGVVITATALAAPSTTNP